MDQRRIPGISSSLNMYLDVFKFKISEFTSDICPQYLEALFDYLSQHPYIAISLLAIGITCIIPVLVFLLFAGLSIFVTFFLFFAAEGTLIIIGLGVLIGVVITLCSVLLIGLVTATIAWYLFTQFVEYISNSYDDTDHISPQVKRK